MKFYVSYSVQALLLPCTKLLALLNFYQRDRALAEKQKREKPHLCIYQNVSNNNIK